MVWLLICLCWNDDHHNYDRDYNHDDDRWDVEDNDDVLRINGSLSNTLVLLCPMMIGDHQNGMVIIINHDNDDDNDEKLE